MPIVTIKIVQGSLSINEQQLLIDEVGEAFVRVLGEGVRPWLNVIVEEVGSGLWGRGGRRLTTEALVEARTRTGQGS